MANNYLQFSVEAEIINHEKLEESLQVLKELTDKLPTEEELKNYCPKSATKESRVAWQDFAECRVTFEFQGFHHDVFKDKLYLFDEEWGIVENTAYFLHFLMVEKIISAEPILFAWAETCSKPRAGEFSGGACLISLMGIEWQDSPQQWADSILQKWKYSR
jgi:hypothetical protein